MPFGLIFSFACHAALLIWAYGSMRAVPHLPVEDTPMISADIITPSEFLRLKQGSEDAKKLETKAKDELKQDDSKNDTKKPDNAPPPPPPPPQEVAKVEPPPPPEPPKVEPPPPPEPPKVEAPPLPPEPAPGPTPDEQKLLEQKIEEAAKKAQEEEAKKKAEADAKKKADEALKKKLADEAKKKKAEDAKKKAEAEAKKFDANKLANLIEKAPDDAEKQKALLDKDPTKKGQQAAGTSQTATETGKEAGTKTGADTVLSAREQDLIAGQIKAQLQRCSKMPGGGGGIDTPVVTVQWHVRQDGSLDGEPVVLQPQNTPLFRIAAEASVNAVRNCSPLDLPPDKYRAWSKITWDFDWPKILGLR